MTSPGLQARASRREITPNHLPIALGGYSEGQVAKTTSSTLEVNCICLDDGSRSVVIVSMDLLYVTHELRQAVLADLAGLGVGPAELFMAASHTHYAPAIDSTKPLLGTPDADYLDRISSIVIEAVRDAVLGPKEDVRLAFGQAAGVIGVNRRRKRAFRLSRMGIEFNQIAMSPNPDRSVDPVISVLELAGGGRTVAWLWSAACHPTGLADGAGVSAHWPGVVRGHLRLQSGGGGADELPVIFLQGFSGDVRPPSGRRKSGKLRGLLKHVLLGPVFEALDESEYMTWARSIALQVGSITSDGLRALDTGSLDCARIELPASDFASGAEHLPPVSFHSVSIGPVVLVGASAEPVSGYADRVRAMAPEMRVIPVGCIDHVIGYWPLQEMFQEGGYEVAHHCASFGIANCNPDIEKTSLDQFRLLLDRPRTTSRRNP